ncbi:MAG TPA: flagellar biosynthesis protein FlhF [Firmicutes bacterium]|nr:flagellar biosynthesis protein FlhF [Bacillota bacterium]
MRIKKFYAQDMREGMYRIKEELGPEAVILQSRKVRGGRGLLGYFLPSRLEITVAVDTVKNTRRPEASPRQDFEIKIQEMLGELRGNVRELMSRPVAPPEPPEIRPELLRWQEHLQRQDVYPQLIEELIQEMEESLPVETPLSDEISGLILQKKLRKRLMTAPEKGAPIQIFVGPTGVGKTTTLAKLAARYALYQGERVGIITIDHYRIGAIEQMRTYSDITGLPLEVVMTPRELLGAIERFKGCQRILIDTAGRSTLNRAHIQELAGYLKKLPPSEIFLVVSATTKWQDLQLISENFRPMEFNRLIFTKLDETNSFGILINGCFMTKVPAIYLTYGQSVPDDICLADKEKMSSLILGEEV